MITPEALSCFLSNGLSEYRGRPIPSHYSHFLSFRPVVLPVLAERAFQAVVSGERLTLGEEKRLAGCGGAAEGHAWRCYSRALLDNASAHERLKLAAAGIVRGDDGEWRSNHHPARCMPIF